MRPTQKFCVVAQVAFIVFAFFAPTTDAIFGLVEVDWLNDTIYLSPVQVMFLGIFLMFLTIIGFFQWGPPQAFPVPPSGRLLTSDGALNVTALNAGLRTVENMWDLGKVHSEATVACALYLLISDTILYFFLNRKSDP
jgi:hypothetical protein